MEAFLNLMEFFDLKNNGAEKLTEFELETLAKLKPLKGELIRAKESMKTNTVVQKVENLEWKSILNRKGR